MHLCIESFDAAAGNVWACIGSPQLMTICLSIVQSYGSAEKRDLQPVLALTTSQQPCLVIVIQVLGNWLALMAVALSCSPLLAICDPPRQLLTIHGEVGRKGHKSQSSDVSMAVGNLLNDLCNKGHKAVCNHVLSPLTTALLNNAFASPCCGNYMMNGCN